MGKRVRLTNKFRKAVESGERSKEEFPGDVGNEDRKDPTPDQYVIGDPSDFAEDVDKSNKWKEDGKREENNMGVTRMSSAQKAKVRAAASKAVKLAVCLLGDKVADDLIESQAKDFLKLGSEGLDRTLKRFSDTEELYKVAKEGKSEKMTEDNKNVMFSANDEVEAAKKDKDEKDEKEAAKKDEDEKDEKEAAKKDEDEKDEKKAEDEEKKEDEKPEMIAEKEDEPEMETASDASGIDIVLSSDEISASLDFDALDDRKASDLIAGLLDGKDVEVPVKKGVKKLGGQPRVASNQNQTNELDMLWEKTPDISKLL